MTTLPNLTRRRRWPEAGSLLVALTVGAMVAAMPVTATAGASATRYAAPHGSGTACTQATPCSLRVAIEQAPGGADIYIPAGQGDYEFSSDLLTDAPGLHLHGTGGRPRLVSTGGELKLLGGTADNLLVLGSSDRTAMAFEDGAVADRIVVRGGSGVHACYMRDSTVTNSICQAATDGDLAVETDGSNVLRNVTLVGGTEAALLAYGRTDDCSCATATDTLVNVIARAGAGGVDLVANSDGTADVTIAASYSNYATTDTTGSGAQVNGDATNQTATPAFVDASTGNLHEAAGSPTIDAGIDDAANGDADIDGGDRSVGAATDIGADEWVTPPPDTEITKVTVRKAKHKARFVFRAHGAASGFKCSLARVKPGTPAAPSASCESPTTYRHLKSGTYRFKVRAVGPAGTDPTPAKKKFRI
jgi:hypothetical protein